MQSEPVRLNKFIAQHSTYSRRKADDIIGAGRVQINGQPATTGQTVTEQDEVTIDGTSLKPAAATFITVVLNKPKGYVCSRDGQGSPTIYELLPASLQHLNSVGRLDKDSSGLLLITNDGQLANELTHPRYQKTKVYEVTLNKPLQPLHQQMISDYGISLDDGVSKLQLTKQDDSAKNLLVTMHEGRNRQIRRTFIALGYSVQTLHRITFGNYQLNDLKSGQVRELVT